MIVEARKRCSGCGEEKPLSEFHRRAKASDGRQSYCKPCNIEFVKQYDERTDSGRVRRRASTYGLTCEDVRGMLQIPACQACGAAFPSDTAQKFDHCHTGGHLRGVLCHKCNMACAGTSAEAIPRLRACIDYLQRDLERIGEPA